MTILLTQIDDSERARDIKKHGDTSLTKDSISRVGLIQPLILSRNSDDTYKLVAGGRRICMLREMGFTEVHHGTTLDPLRPGFVFADEVPEHVRLEAELDENLHRLGMDWIDTAMLIYRTHVAKKSVDPVWNQKKTTQLLGYNSEASVSNYIRAAKEIIAGNTEVLACKSVRDANILYYKRREDAALAELQKRNAAKIGGGLRSATTDTILSLLETQEQTEQPVTITVQERVLDPFAHTTPRAQVPLSAQFFLRDSILDSTPWPLVDHVVTDMPYAIEMDNLGDTQVQDVRDTHDVEDNIELMEPFLRKAFAAVKSCGFCVFFFDLDHWNYLQSLAKSIGWRVQDWPVIACKTSACRNTCAQYNTTKNYEVYAMLRKDANTVLRKPQPTSWRQYDFVTERKLYSNPFAKPFQVWKDIYDAIAFPGQSVLDPYAGEMSACRAAANCGLTPFGIEVDDRHYNRGLEHMKKVYAVIHNSNCDYV